jgi:hypothetical protein
LNQPHDAILKKCAIFEKNDFGMGVPYGPPTASAAATLGTNTPQYY